MPYLKQEHQIRVFDVAPPPDSSLEYVSGSVDDAGAIRDALDGIEAVIYMALGRKASGGYALDEIDLNYDVSVKGLHKVLQATTEAKVPRAVYTSTLSVHGSRPGGICASEDTPCDAAGVYGFTKWLGELVCDYFARTHGLTVVALRLNAPVAQDDWHRRCEPGRPNVITSAPDVARALSLALSAPVTGFHAVFISGDYDGKLINCARAKQLLGWEPLERPREPDEREACSCGKGKPQ